VVDEVTPLALFMSGELAQFAHDMIHGTTIRVPFGEYAIRGHMSERVLATIVLIRVIFVVVARPSLIGGVLVDFADMASQVNIWTGTATTIMSSICPSS
jgi:hypothetical protein